ncbi:MAG TPA: hypothetical protein VMB49_08080 [Acidobacteriaceae bacterium]|nr:hypothetical protein [Acidobacteriaceae bacterium]
MLLLLKYHALGQATPGAASIKAPPAAAQAWRYYLNVDGYIVPGGTSFFNPDLTVDHSWLHLEARYNYEDLRTGSLWVGYNFARGDVDDGSRWELAITPILGGVFGRTTGIAPGCEISLNYRKKFAAYIENEYVFDTQSKSGNFYYAWPQVTYSPREWLHLGGVAQHTVAYATKVDAQGGFLVGVSRKNWEFTTYVFNPGFSGTAVVLESGVSF